MATTLTGYTGNLKLPNQQSVSSDSITTNPQPITTNTSTYTGKLKLPSVSTSITGEPSSFEKFKYGMGKELTFFGELYDLSRAFYNSYGPMTFEDARQDVKEQRQKELEERFTWAKDKAYESDSAVLAGRIAQSVFDPFYIMFPYARAAQAGKLIGKGGAALAGLGAGIGATDISVRSLANTGEVKLQDVALGAGAGAVLSPVAMGVQKGLGAAANKLFPNLFKNKQMQDAVNDQLRNNYKTKYNLNDKQLDNVYKISSIQSIQNLTGQVDNNYKLFIEPLQKLQTALNSVSSKFTSSTPLNPNKLVNIIKDMPGGLNLKFKSLGNKTLSTIKNKKEFDKIQTELTSEVTALVDKQIKKSNRLNTKLQIEITKELHKAGGLTSAAARAITSIAVRPAIGAGGGAVFATLGDVDDDSFVAMVAGGAALGGLHRHLMRGGIKSIPLPKQISFAKSIKTNYFNNLGRNLRIITAATQQSKLTARGPVLDEFSNQMFYRPTDTVRLDWLGKIAKNQDESIGLVGTGTSVEERMEQAMSVWTTKIFKEVLQDSDVATQQTAIQIVRGKTGVKNKNARDLAKRIKTYLGEFRNYYKEVGFTEKELLKNYFPRKFNFNLINENKDDFVKRVAQAYINIGKAPDMKEGKRLAGIYIQNLEGNYTKQIFDEDSLIKLMRGKKTDVKLPISQHIEYERSLQGKYNQVEELLEPYLVNETGTVLMDLARTSVKSVEFARTFGNKGQLLSSYLRRLEQQYKDNGFNKGLNYYEGGQHKADVDSIRHAVNSYFGRYGRRGTDTERSTAAILSTLANFNMMDKVTIANLGDLVQPFQNSRFFLSAIRGIGQSASSDMAIKENKIIRTAIRNAYTTPDGGSSPFLMDKGTGNVMNFIGRSNEFFFKAIGLEAITGIARRYAYNVGAVDAHKSAQRLINRFQQSGLKSLDDLKDAASLADISHLNKVGAIKFNSNRKIINSDDIISFGQSKNLNEAGRNDSVRSLIQTVGNSAANRDAIIPQVGNRLLFTQTRNPLVRIIGQFSSWAMAKSAQTNAMISRVEDANLKQAITMLSALSIFGAVKNLRDFARTGEFEMGREIEKEPGKWLAFSTQMSGNLGWLPTTINNSILTTYGSTPIEFFPAVSIFNEFGEAFRDTTGAFLNKNSYDDALKSWLEFAPAPTVRNILDRAGVPFMVYKKNSNMLDAYKKSNIFKGTSLFNKGGAVTQARKLFNEGDVVQQTVEPSNYQYDLKTEPETEDVYDKEELKTIVKEGPKIVPKKKPVLNTVSANQVYNYLINEKKLDKNKSLGIVANIYGESNFKMDADQAGDGSQGIGLFQHTFSTRKEGLLKAVPDYKTNWKGQIDYALSENEAKRYLNTDFETAEEAAQHFMNYNLQPAEKNREGRTKKHNEYLKSFTSKLNFRYGGYAAMRRAMTSNRAYTGTGGSTNRERYIASSNQSKPKTIISDSGSTNREKYIASQSGGGGNNRGNQSNTNTSSTTTTTTTNTGPVDSGGGSSTKEKTKDKVKKLLKKTGKKIERFTTENADILPGGETYEKAIDTAYGGLTLGKGFRIGENAGASIYVKTGGILKGETTTTIDSSVPGYPKFKTYPTEVPDIDVSNILDDSSVGISAGVGTKYGLFTGGIDTKEGATLGYNVAGDTKFFEPSILGQTMTVGVTPYAKAEFKPMDKADNFDGEIGAKVTTPIGSADVFITEEGKFNIGKSFNFKSGGLLDKKRG